MPTWESADPFDHVDLNYSVQFVSAAEYRVQSTRGLISLQSMTEDGVVDLLGPRLVRLQAQQASVEVFQEDGDGFINIFAGGSEGTIQIASLQDSNHSSIVVSPESIEIQNGPLGTAAGIQVTPQQLKLSIGDMRTGSSIVMTEKSIMFKVGKSRILFTEDLLSTRVERVMTECEGTRFKMGPSGISESTGEVSIKIGMEGHTLKAGETVWKIGMAGLEGECPINKLKTEAAKTNKTTIGQNQAQAVDKSQAGLQQIN